jgi:hypothetical protein
MLIWLLRQFADFRNLEIALHAVIKERDAVMAENIDFTQRISSANSAIEQISGQRNDQSLHFKRLQNQWDEDREELQSKYAILQGELERENSAKIQLQDRIREIDADNLRLLRELADSRQQTIHSSQMIADFFSQQMFGRKVYGAAPDLPEGSQSPEIIPRQRTQARLEVEKTTKDFYDNFRQGKL